MVSVFNDLVSVCCLWSIVCHYHVIHYQYTGLTDGVVWCPADGYQQGHQCPPPQVFPCSQCTIVTLALNYKKIKPELN